MTRRRLQVVLGLVLSALFLWLAFRGVDFGALGQALAMARYELVLPALALYFSGVWLRSLRWRAVLWPIKPVPAHRLFPVVVMGYMANNVLPARLGEVVRAYVLGRREDVSRLSTLATIVVERVLDGLVMLAFMGLVVLILPLTAAMWRLLTAAAALFVIAAAILLSLAVAPAGSQRWARAALRPLPPRAQDVLLPLMVQVLDGLAGLRGAGGVLRALALSFAAWTVEALMYYVLMFAFDIPTSAPAPAALAALTTAVANLGTLIPSSPGYVGVYHYLAKEVLMQFGVPPEPALGYVLVLHAALVVPVTLLGLLYAWREHVQLTTLAAMPAQAPTLAATCGDRL